ncbi:MAG: dihydroneopterin aldolase [Planctomycetota bacterium]
MTYRIRIEHLVLVTRIGVTAEERAEPQQIAVDLDMEVDAGAAGRSDDLSDAVDYAAVADRVTAFAHNHSCALLETLAHELTGLVFVEFPLVAAVTVTLHKPQAIDAARDVTLTIRRIRE